MQTDVDIFETQSDSDKELTCQTIAKFLLQQRYVLTAFELLHELLEDGQLKAASKLQDYFGDQEMFPPDQMVQLQSLKALDTHRLCDEKDMAENRAVFAEKEVEEARNEIRLLEKQLEEKTELCSLIEGLNEEDVENNKHLLKKAISKRALSSKGEFIQNEERKILNFAVKEYLVSAGYKLTAMTFYDEVDQNLDEWPEGKIRVEKTLRTYYHHFYTCINDENELIDLREENKSIKEDKVFFEKEKNVYLNELNEIKKKLLEKDRTIATLEKEKEKIEKESNQIKSELTSFKLRIEQIEKEKNEYLNFVKSMKEENERLMNISKMSIINNHDYNQSKPLDSMETDMNLKNDHSNFSSSSSSLHNMNEVEVVYVNKEEISLNVNDDSLSQKEKEKRMGLIENEEDKVEKKEETKDREEERGEREGEGREEDDGSCDYSKHDGMDGNVNDDNDDIIHKHKNKFNDALNTSNDDDYNDNDVKKSYSFDKNDGEVNEEEMKTIIENTKDEINDKDNDNDKNKDNDNDKDDDDLYCVRIIADSLPKIIPNVLINHREELLPLILCAIERHPDVTTRDQLTHNLFNLIKKPNHEQRAIIMHACMDLACKIGEERTETELLPQCWEQIIHKLPERRLLVSLSCGQLAPFVNYELRSSLILSILQQLCDDPDPIVRESVATNLSVLIPLYKDGEKYSKVEELVFRLICDASGSVVEESLKNLFPVFVKWTKAVKHPLSHFLHSILFHLIENIQNCPPFSTLESTFESNFRILNDNNRRNIISILRMLNKIMHDVFSATLCTWPDSLKRKLRNFVSHYESNEHVQVENASDNITHNAVEDGGEGEGEGEGGGGGGGEEKKDMVKGVSEQMNGSSTRVGTGLTQKRYRHVTILAESFGVCLSLRLVLKSPNLISRLVLVNPATNFRNNNPLISFCISTGLLERFPMPLYELAQDFALPLLIKRNKVLKSKENLISPIDYVSSTCANFRLSLLNDESGLEDEQIASIDIPTLLIASAKDRILPSVSETSRLKNLMKNVQRYIIAESGHTIFLEDDTNISEILKNYNFGPPAPETIYKNDQSNIYKNDHLNLKIKESVNDELIDEFCAFVEPWRILTSPLVLGEENLPNPNLLPKRPILFVGNHTIFGLYDTPLLIQQLYLRGFKVKGLALPAHWLTVTGSIMERYGNVKASPFAAYRLLKNGENVLLFPGGSREVCKRKGEEYKLFWKEKVDFVRMASKLNAIIVPFSAIGAEEAFEIVFDANDLSNSVLGQPVRNLFSNLGLSVHEHFQPITAIPGTNIPSLIPIPNLEKVYFYFSEPIDPKNYIPLEENKRWEELYALAKLRVETGIEYLKKEREMDVERNFPERLISKISRLLPELSPRNFF